MTERIYYEDAFCTTFTARIVERLTWQNRAAVILDRSAFYPTSGGQSYDTGAIVGVPVVDVTEDDAGRVVHVLASQPPEYDDITGEIDWSRRFDHMQQHSGQHLLSQVILRRYGYETVGFRIGASDTTIDIPVAPLSPEQIMAIEEDVASLIAQYRPIRCYIVDESELGRVPLRKPPTVRGAIRIVEIADFDFSACGGTHVKSTAAIGAIAITSQEKRGAETRLHVLCGLRVLRAFRHIHNAATSAARLLSSEISDLPQRLARLQSDQAELQQRLDRVSTAYLPYEAQALAVQAHVHGDVRVIRGLFSDRDINGIKSLAAELQKQPQTVVFLGCLMGEKANFIFARSADISQDMGALLRSSLASVNGKGGGSAQLAQGGCAASDAEQALNAAEQVLGANVIRE